MGCDAEPELLVMFGVLGGLSPSGGGPPFCVVGLGVRKGSPPRLVGTLLLGLLPGESVDHSHVTRAAVSVSEVDPAAVLVVRQLVRGFESFGQGLVVGCGPC